MTFWKHCLQATTVLCLSACTGAYFFPMKPLVRTPADLDLAYRDISLTTTDGIKLHAWFLPSETPRGRLLFLHGNAENISTHIGSVHWLPEQGYDVLLLDYRGYGKSEGVPSVPAVFADLDAAWRWLSDYHQEHPLPDCRTPAVLGQSLGGSLATWYFANLPKDSPAPSVVVLDAIFASYPRIGAEALRGNPITWLISPLTYVLLPSRYDPERHIANLDVPLLQFHSPEDGVIPYRHGETAFTRAEQPKQWVEAEGRHIATFNYPKHRNQLLEFIEEHQTSCQAAVARPTHLAEQLFTQ